MGERVTYRTRPRIDSFWVVDNVDTPANLEGFGRMGPFTRKQLMELWFRVKKIRIIASCDWENDNEDPPDSGSASLDVTVTRVRTSDMTLSDINNETELLDEWNANAYLAFYDSAEISWFRATESLPRQSMDQDTNGDYWLDDGIPGAVLSVSDGADFSVAALGGSGQLTVSLEFSDTSTVSFDLSFVVAGATSTSNRAATVEILEWYPYADRDDDPAWDTATGLQANGGPGG